MSTAKRDVWGELQELYVRSIRWDKKVAWTLDNLGQSARDGGSASVSASVTSRQEERARPLRTMFIFYWLSRALGILPYCFNLKTKSLQLCKPALVFSVLTIMFLLSQWSFLVEELYQEFVEGNVMSGLEPVILTLLNCTLMLVSLLRSSHLCRIVRVMVDLDNELTPRGPGPSMLPCIYPSLLTLTSCVVDVAVSVTDSTVADTLLYICYYWAAIGAALVETQFSVACCALRYWTWLLNERLKMTRRKSIGAALRLESLRLTHNRVCTAAVHLDAAFGPQLLLSCGLCFIGTVLNAYFGVNGFYDGGNGTEATPVMQQTQWLWAALYLSRVFTVCFTATRLASEATQTGRLVHGLCDSRLPAQMKEELTLFSMQLSTSKIEFSAWGFLVIDFSLLFAIVSSTTTYLLILIQYRPK